MTITPQLFREASAEALSTSINAFLAPFFGGSARKVIGVVLDTKANAPFFNSNLYANITVDSTGVGPQSAPFQFQVFTASIESSVLTKINAFIAANPSYFFSQVFSVYRPEEPNPNLGVALGIFFSTDSAAYLNWFSTAATGGGGPPGGPAGGDLGGTYPNPTVEGVQGNPIGPFGVAGQALVIGDDNASLVWYATRVYTSLALAAADQANQVIGQQIIIFNAVPSPDDGTYQLNAKTASPADYTLVDTGTVTAANVSIADAGGYYAGTNVEAALQELGPILTANTQQTAVLPVATTPEQSFVLANTQSVEIEFSLTKGAVRYVSLVRATHDGAAAYWSEANTVVSPGTIDASVSFDVLGANLRFLATAATVGWTLRWIVRQLTT